LEEFLVSNGSTALILLIYKREQFYSNTYTYTLLYQLQYSRALVSCHSCVHEEVGMNQKGKNKK